MNMKTTKTLLFAVGLAAAFTACSTKDDENPTGSWVEAAPQSVTETVAGAKTATKVISIDFQAPASKGQAGELTYAAEYDVTVAADSATETPASSYKVTASIKGTWAQDGDDDDDYLISFDKNSLSVQGTDAPELGPVTDDFMNSLSKLTSIEDVEVSKDGAHLTFETKAPKVKYHFVKK